MSHFSLHHFSSLIIVVLASNLTSYQVLLGEMSVSAPSVQTRNHSCTVELARFSEQTVGKRGVQTPVQREYTLWLNAQRCYTRKRQRTPIRPSSSGPPSPKVEDTRRLLSILPHDSGWNAVDWMFFYFQQFACVFVNITNKISTLVSLHYTRGSIL